MGTAKRKKMLIDKKFQLKTTFSIIGVVSIISAIIIGAISTSIIYNNNKIANINEIEDNIVLFLANRPANAEKDVTFKQAMNDIAKSHSDNMITMNLMIKINKWLMILLVVFIIVQGIVLYYLLIRKTHKISGPIFVMSNYMKEIIAGKYPAPRKLREKDELQDFYGVFMQMCDALKQKANK